MHPENPLDFGATDFLKTQKRLRLKQCPEVVSCLARQKNFPSNPEEPALRVSVKEFHLPLLQNRKDNLKKAS